MKILLITDSCSDLPVKYTEDNNILIMPLTFHFKGVDYQDDFGKSISYKDFYNELRKGEMSSTSQINPSTFEETFRKYVSEGYS